MLFSSANTLLIGGLKTCCWPLSSMGKSPDLGDTAQQEFDAAVKEAIRTEETTHAKIRIASAVTLCCVPLLTETSNSRLLESF